MLGRSLIVKLSNTMSLVKVKTKSQVTIPEAIRQQLGVQVGDLLEARIEKGTIVLKPKAVIDRPAREEYTPAQRRIIDREISKGMRDVKQGRTFGPFRTHAEMIEVLHKEVKKAQGKKTRNTKVG